MGREFQFTLPQNRRPMNIDSILSEANQLAKSLKITYSLPEVVFEDLPDNYAGLFYQDKNLIEIDQRVENLEWVIRHELAHSIQFAIWPDSQWHGPEFRAIAYYLNAPYNVGLNWRFPKKAYIFSDYTVSKTKNKGKEILCGPKKI